MCRQTVTVTNATMTSNNEYDTACLPSSTAATTTTTSTTSEDFRDLVEQLSARLRPRVHFEDSVSIIGNDNGCCSVPSIDEIKSLWYQRPDIHRFKLEARDQILMQNQREHIAKNVAMTCLETNQESRGFERYTIQRAQWKVFSIKSTLLAFQQGMNEDFVCSISKECSAWQRKRAFIQACHDYCDVYHPNLTSLIPVMSNIPPTPPVELPLTTIKQRKRRRIS